MEDNNTCVERPTKRQKNCVDNWTQVKSLVATSSGIAATTTSNSDDAVVITLPPEVWAAVMNYLDYESVLSCAATSRSLLHDAMPLVTMLHIEKSSQLNAVAPQRFRDVQEINILSLLRQRTENSSPQVGSNTVAWVVLFLSRFNKLQKVFFGGRNASGDVIGFEQSIRRASSNGLHISTLINQISEAYRRGFFSKDLCVLGLRCPISSRSSASAMDTTSHCQVCLKACRLWPLEHVLNFENKGLSEIHSLRFYSKRPCGLDVCLSRSQIESAVQARPGGRDLLQSEARLFYLLGRGSRFVVYSDEGNPFYIVTFYKDVLNEIKRVINVSGLDVSKLAREDVRAAIMKSFAINKNGTIPPKELCYLGITAIHQLIKETDLPLCEEDFLASVLANGKNLLPQIVKAVGRDKSICCFECMTLLGKLISAKEDPPIQPAIDLGVVPLLGSFLKARNNPSDQEVLFTTNAVFVLGCVAIGKNGASDHTQVLIQADVIPVLIGALGLENQQVANHAALALGRVASISATSRDLVLHAGVVAPLITALEKCDNPTTISWTLSVICHGVRNPDFAMLKPTLEPLCRIIMKNEEQKVLVLVYSCFALSHLCKVPNEEVVPLIDAGIYPCLVELLRHPSIQVRTGVLMLISSLLVKGNSLIHTLVLENAIPKLISSLDSTCSFARKYARWIICDVMKDSRGSIPSFVHNGSIEHFCTVLFSHDVTNVQFGLMGLTKILRYARTESDEAVSNTIAKDIGLIEGKLGQLEKETIDNAERWSLLQECMDDLKKEVEGHKAPTGNPCNGHTQDASSDVKASSA